MAGSDGALDREKAALRRAFRGQKVPPEVAADLSRRIVAHLLAHPAYRAAAVVAAYAPLPGEVDVRPLWTAVWEAGKTLALPRVEGRGRPLRFYRVEPTAVLSPGTFGILEPPPEEAVDGAAIDLVLVPGLAFDRRGVRLGYGGGFYDRTLPGLRRALRVAPAFPWQIVDRLPAAAHDVRVDVLFLPDGPVLIAGSEGAEKPARQEELAQNGGKAVAEEKAEVPAEVPADGFKKSSGEANGA
ncbi:MAG: 5-formyltetrahydrofolate cyclo-ligase [Hydrogenibacillus schlegelii]|uniref:5-formyltetrahydrofolate cyclo-ligase n=1 Tax=Hydrogenibacillus schlegelii TaxID=1484 RepID=A0A2T5GCB4_HYDSH|nr:5-formyltetrahydrofolate cyclo-ligase [Hydrogenibacillus schlegelii]PTQ53778.1 MAG: 5-formyltetrahydrofolate cyclo-ligase [Hydrogenibacillus schlegelii]